MTPTMPNDHEVGRPLCVVGIPMTNLYEQTARVLADLDFDAVDELVIYDHASDDPMTLAWLAAIEFAPKVTVDRRGGIPDESLYRSWNDTIRRALARSDAPEVDVVLLNNDVRIPPGFIRLLTRALRSGGPDVLIVYPDAQADLLAGVPDEIRLTPTTGLHADGGLTGYAFGVKAEAFRDRLPLIDERLKLYSGDRDLIHNVERRGYHAARVEGLPCQHSHGATRRLRPELAETQRRDVALWWGEHPEARTSQAPPGASTGGPA